MSKYNLLGVGADAKTVKGEKFGYLTGILYLQPADLSGVNLCPNSSAGCREVCLFSAGRGAMKNVQDGRARKTQMFLSNYEQFMRELYADISKLAKEAAKAGMSAVVRLNGTSDVLWENKLIDGKNLFEHFPNVQFMDYTKHPQRMFPGSKARSFANYHLTFSLSEENRAKAELVAKAGGNVAVVFRPHLPTEFWGRPVIDGDISDLRFTDGHGVIVGLKAKGRAKKDNSGFVIDVA